MNILTSNEIVERKNIKMKKKKLCNEKNLILKIKILIFKAGHNIQMDCIVRQIGSKMVSNLIFPLLLFG